MLNEDASDDLQDDDVDSEHTRADPKAERKALVKQIQAEVIAILGRMVTVKELQEGFGLRQSTFYDQIDEKRLITFKNLVRLADNLGINTVQLLVARGLLDHAEVEEYYLDTLPPGSMAPRREA